MMCALITGGREFAALVEVQQHAKITVGFTIPGVSSGRLVSFSNLFTNHGRELTQINLRKVREGRSLSAQEEHTNSQCYNRIQEAPPHAPIVKSSEATKSSGITAVRMSGGILIGSYSAHGNPK